MNTILTDDERPKLPTSEYSLAFYDEGGAQTLDAAAYTEQDMEAYADAREAAVLAKLRAGVERSAAPEAPEQADVHMPRFNDFERKTLLSVATWMEARKGAVWAKQFNFSRLMEKWAKELRAMLAAPMPAVVQVPQEFDYKHPKAQALIGADARHRIIIDLVWQILEDPRREFTASDMEYWDKLHDKVQEVALAAAPEASAQGVCRNDGRCQYAIDHGVEGLGHCPAGKCVMPTLPAEVREAIKVAREALIDAKTFVGAWPEGTAALARLDALVGAA